MLLVCEVWLIDATSALHLYPAYSGLVKFRKNECEKPEKESMREEIWWQITVRQARTSRPGLGCLWWRGCELSVNVKLSKWKSIMCVCQCLTSEEWPRTTASRAKRWARRCMCVFGMIQHITDRSLVNHQHQLWSVGTILLPYIILKCTWSCACYGRYVCMHLCACMQEFA